MKVFRSLAFLLTLASLLFGQLLFAQQEVAPDHFDGSDAQVQKAAPVYQQKHAHSTMAKKGSPKHHRSHASA